MDKIYLVMDGSVVGYATTEEKANKMVEKLKEEYGEDVLDYKIVPMETNVLCFDEEKFSF